MAQTLEKLPRIHRLTLAVVNAVPEWHPEHATFEPFPVHGWVIDHPDGAILVDTGVGVGNSVINEWYRPDVTPISNALGTLGKAPSDIAGLVLSHLHFDHSGQLHSLGAPVYVQAAEHKAAQVASERPDWARIPEARLRLIAGDEAIAEGIRLLWTPGHTPGHQAVVVEGGGRRVVLAAQCAYRASELRSGEPDLANLHDHDWLAAARDSLRRVRGLAPFEAQFSHDPQIITIDG